MYQGRNSGEKDIGKVSTHLDCSVELMFVQVQKKLANSLNI